ncbi:hypothetical protein Q0P29_14200, partial [Staphylococcus aureus]|nr:hypothetical protein [Staphylococcus aureus]
KTQLVLEQRAREGCPHVLNRETSVPQVGHRRAEVNLEDGPEGVDALGELDGVVGWGDRVATCA